MPKVDCCDGKFSLLFYFELVFIGEHLVSEFSFNNLVTACERELLDA